MLPWGNSTRHILNSWLGVQGFVVDDVKKGEIFVLPPEIDPPSRSVINIHRNKSVRSFCFDWNFFFISLMAKTFILEGVKIPQLTFQFVAN